MASSLNLILSNLRTLVRRRLPRRTLLFAPVLPSRHVSDFYKYGLVHRDGNNHSSKYRIVACSVNLILSNLPNLVNRRLPRRSLLFAPVLPSRHVSDCF